MNGTVRRCHDDCSGKEEEVVEEEKEKENENV